VRRMREQLLLPKRCGCSPGLLLPLGPRR
jgi:hypothetical protein